MIDRTETTVNPQAPVPASLSSPGPNLITHSILKVPDITFHEHLASFHGNIAVKIFFLEVGRGGSYLICIKSDANCTKGAKPHEAQSEKKRKYKREKNTKAEERATEYERKNMQN